MAFRLGVKIYYRGRWRCISAHSASHKSIGWSGIALAAKRRGDGVATVDDAVDIVAVWCR